MTKTERLARDTRMREIICQTCAELGVHIVKGVLARDHMHMVINVPPKLALSSVMRRLKGRSSRRVQIEFPELRKRYCGGGVWAHEYFSTTSGNFADNIIFQYLELHAKSRVSKVEDRRQWLPEPVAQLTDNRLAALTLLWRCQPPFGWVWFHPKMSPLSNFSHRRE